MRAGRQLGRLASPRNMSISGVVFGFVIGQGALFLLNSLLLARGDAVLVGNLGLTIGFLSLGIWVLDLGGAFYLQRALDLGTTTSVLSAVIVGRLSLCLPVAVAAFAAVGLVPELSFSTEGILWGLVFAAPVWAFNLSGLLDAKGYAGFAGAIGNFGTLFAAAYICCALYRHTQVDPKSIAIAFSLGLTLIVAVHHLGLKTWWGARPTWVLPTSREAKDFMRFGYGYVASQVPAQAYGRGVILLVSLGAGAAAAGYYVYIKTILNGFAQVATAIRRVDFRAIVCRVSTRREGFLNLISYGRFGYFVLAAPVLCATLFFMQVGRDSHYYEAARALPAFAIVFSAWVYASNAGNVVLATGRVTSFVSSNVTSIAASLAISLALIPLAGIVGVAIAEMAMHTIQIVLYRRAYITFVGSSQCAS